MQQKKHANSAEKPNTIVVGTGAKHQDRLRLLSSVVLLIEKFVRCLGGNRAMATLQWSSKDLELLPDDMSGKRYEIIDGELYVSKQPRWEHQFVCNRLWEVLQVWSRRTKMGVANSA